MGDREWSQVPSRGRGRASKTRQENERAGSRPPHNGTAGSNAPRKAGESSNGQQSYSSASSSGPPRHAAQSNGQQSYSSASSSGPPRHAAQSNGQQSYSSAWSSGAPRHAAQSNGQQSYSSASSSGAPRHAAQSNGQPSHSSASSSSGSPRQAATPNQPQSYSSASSSSCGSPRSATPSCTEQSYPRASTTANPPEKSRPISACGKTPPEAASNGGSSREGDSGSVVTKAMRDLRIEKITKKPTKQGTLGTRMMLQANYFKISSLPDWCLLHYKVDFSPEEDRTPVRKALVRHVKDKLGAYLFDGSSLFTNNRLDTPMEFHATRKEDSQVIRVTIKRVGELDRSDYQYLQVFNIIMRKCLEHLELQLVGRNFFDPQNKVVVRDYQLEIWPGYITSIRQHEHDILMCAEISHKVMRDQTLLNVLRDCFNNNSHDYKGLFHKEVVGTTVLTDYNNRTYKIDDIDYDVTPRSTFRQKNGEEISYVDYYRTKYQITLRDPKQPLLVSRTKPRERRAGEAELIYLIPELCRCTGLTDRMKNNFRLMQALAQHTRVSPSSRIEKLMKFNERLYGVQNVTDEFRSWNLKLEQKLVDVPARKLPNQTIVFGGDAKSVVPDNADWTREFRSKKLRSTDQLRTWAVIAPRNLAKDCQNFVKCLQDVSAKMNFGILNPSFHPLDRDTPDNYAHALEHILSQKNPQIIFCALSTSRGDIYSAIKKKCCVDRPVPTQVILEKSIKAKSVMSVATKVAVQMNCKIGGYPWSMDIPKNLMVVGFDVCHDSKNKAKDYGAMVASLNPDCGRYFSAVSAHTDGNELSDDISVNLCKALQLYREINKTYPTYIIVYRDGVGEGQVNYVINHEVKQVREKLVKLYGDPARVKLAYIIVTKRINTRLFHNQSNPSPGTVVDDVITDPSKYDFFIVSQHVNQGTVSPTSYTVVEDTLGISAEKIQKLTYQLCHMYYNWSGTIRVPAPCQYAHKLAFLVSQSINAIPSNQLEKLLYFL